MNSHLSCIYYFPQERIFLLKQKESWKDVQSYPFLWYYCRVLQKRAHTCISAEVEVQQRMNVFPPKKAVAQQGSWKKKIRSSCQHAC
jgi:hypothetical protein